MHVDLAYGRGRRRLDLPIEVEIIEGQYVSGLPDETYALQQACRFPIGSPSLRELIRPTDQVTIVHSDITRPTPNDRIIPVILEEIALAGTPRENVVLLNALGTHRPQTEAELRTMLGDQIVDHYRCEQHNCLSAGDLVDVGTTSFGNRVQLNRLLVEANVRILTGFIEPHFFAGFSGGPKAVLPAMAGSESVLSNHGWHMIGHPMATWGETVGNPVWEEMLEASLMIAPTFLLNVTLNSRRQITGVFAGDLCQAHAQGCRFVRASAMCEVAEPFDIVITSNSGYPLDQNLYQCVKGMSAANRIVKEGGDIVVVAECSEGLPKHGSYADILRSAESPRQVLQHLKDPRFAQLDQWQVQIQAAIQIRANVHVHTNGLTDQEIRGSHCMPCIDVASLVFQRAMTLSDPKDLRVAVIPEGPQTIAYLV